MRISRNDMATVRLCQLGISSFAQSLDYCNNLAPVSTIMIAVFANKKEHWINLRFAALVVCLLISVSPHLVTIFTAMHPYAGLSMASLMIGYMTDKSEHIILIKRLLPFFILSCLFIDWHHWQKSYESGLIGKRMAEDIIKKQANASTAYML